MGTKHYHVYFQTIGCIPDDNDIFWTKKDALKFLRDGAWEIRDSGRNISGSAETGYDVDAINLFYCEPCTDPDCLDELDS